MSDAEPITPSDVDEARATWRQDAPVVAKTLLDAQAEDEGG